MRPTEEERDREREREIERERVVSCEACIKFTNFLLLLSYFIGNSVKANLVSKDVDFFPTINLSKLNNNFDGSKEVLYTTGHPARQHSRVEIRSKAISQ